jgi:hypothetical protein
VGECDFPSCSKKMHCVYKTWYLMLFSPQLPQVLQRDNNNSNCHEYKFACALFPLSWSLFIILSIFRVKIGFMTRL